MPAAVIHRVQVWAQRRAQIMPAGFDWVFVVCVDLTVVGIGAIAAAQRPAADWPQTTLAVMVAVVPWVAFFVFGFSRHEGPALWAAWTGATAILLFTTSAPISGDFAPLLLSLTVGIVGAITSMRGGTLAAASACILLAAATAAHRIDTPALYVAAVGIGWLVGYLMHVQQRLILKQRRMQTELAALVAADERRRIAGDVHDVIAHSLSVTLLHVTGSRHILEHAGDHLDVVAALRQAEHVGRQAMDDIRHTVGLLHAGTHSHNSEPAIADIAALIEDFRRAGLQVDATISADLDQVSAATGMGLYRVVQESLSNVAKHAPTSACSVTVTVDRRRASVHVANQLPATAATLSANTGRGIGGMRQRIELLGGIIEIQPGPHIWSVRADIPLTSDNNDAARTTGGP